jgi:hypothetical protein
MPVSNQFKAKMRARYAHLYAPAALGKLYQKPPKQKKLPPKPLPRGATLPLDDRPADRYLHSADRPPIRHV